MLDSGVLIWLFLSEVETLGSEEISCDTKTIVIEFNSNKQGQFIKISEVHVLLFVYEVRNSLFYLFMCVSFMYLTARVALFMATKDPLTL